MATLTAPRTIKKGEEFVIIPRKTYEEFLRTTKANGKDIIVKHSFKVPMIFHSIKKHPK